MTEAQSKAEGWALLAADDILEALERTPWFPYARRTLARLIVRRLLLGRPWPAPIPAWVYPTVPGECECEHCGLRYSDHPPDPDLASLTRLCDGRRVRL